MRKKIFFLMALCTSCMGAKDPKLSLFTEYVTVERLPSYQMKTPDPALLCPDYGEKLHISWRVPSRYTALCLKISLRFHNGQEEQFTLYLETYHDTYIYTLLNEDYITKGGILTYSAELWGDNQLLYLWQHPLWSEKIHLER